MCHINRNFVDDQKKNVSQQVTVYLKQYCQCLGLPTELGYFEITCRGSKNCWAGGLNWATFHPSTLAWQLFFLQICQFPVNSETVKPFQFPRTFYSWISGIKTSWRAISTWCDYSLHGEVDNQIVFPPNWAILIILLLKNAQIQKIGRVIA